MPAKTVVARSAVRDSMKAAHEQRVRTISCRFIDDSCHELAWLGSDSSVACDRDGVIVPPADAQRAYKAFVYEAEEQGLGGMCRTCFNDFVEMNYEFVRARVVSRAKGEPTDWFVPMQWCGRGR